jgi:hypothetical protein
MMWGEIEEDKRVGGLHDSDSRKKREGGVGWRGGGG